MMIYPKKFLKGLKAVLQDRVIVLDYPWKADSRYSQSAIISAELNYICESANTHADLLIEAICSDWEVFNNFPITYTKGSRVYWQNNYLPGLDIISLFSMLRVLNPGKIVEIGSGHSTAVMHSSIIYNKLQSKLICIDPNPRREINDLADVWIAQPLEAMQDYSLFSDLRAGDVVFFDGSHISIANSDVTVFFLEILPILHTGVHICIHDIYLPFDYPTDMAKKGYNEQYLLALVLMLGNHKFEVLFPAYFTYLRSGAQLKLNELVWNKIAHAHRIEKHGGSFWFKVR